MSSSLSLDAQPAETKSWPPTTSLLGGRIPWGPTALGPDTAVVASEDSSLSVVGPQGIHGPSIALPARPSGPTSTTPLDAGTLVAVPLLGGQVAVYDWDPQASTFSSRFTASHTAVTGHLAWGPNQSLAVAWSDGYLALFDALGRKLWHHQADAPVDAVLWDLSKGIWTLGGGYGQRWSADGVLQARTPLPGKVKGVMMTQGGQVAVWSDQGLWVSRDDKTFLPWSNSPTILGIVEDSQGALLVTSPNDIRRWTSATSQTLLFSLSFDALAGSLVEDRGRILVPTTRGLEERTYDGRLLALWGTSAPASSPLLTSHGLLVWGTQDWHVLTRSGFQGSSSWFEMGGSPGRPFHGSSPASIQELRSAWSSSPPFSYWLRLASSPRQADQAQVLDWLESESKKATLTERWPWANVLLLTIARSGLSDLSLLNGQVINSWPNLRWRAFRLLETTAESTDRLELLQLSDQEYDPSAAAALILALGHSGWDGDGAIVAHLAKLLDRMPDQPQVDRAILQALRLLWARNGASTNPELLSIASRLFQSSAPRDVKNAAQQLFQDWLGS